MQEDDRQHVTTLWENVKRHVKAMQEKDGVSSPLNSTLNALPEHCCNTAAWIKRTLLAKLFIEEKNKKDFHL